MERGGLERDGRLWILPLIAVLGYPGLLLCFDGAINGYHVSASPLLAMGAVLTMMLVGTIPLLALRALVIERHDASSVLARGSLYVMFATPSLFSLTATLTRLAGVRQTLGLVVIWVCMWLAAGLALYVRTAANIPAEQDKKPTRLRVIHGMAALCVLGGFLVAHLAASTSWSSSAPMSSPS